jgi:hypothetical protein
MLLLGLVIFAIIWTRLRKQKVGDLDSFLDLKWLFPSRNKKVTYEDIRNYISPRAVCRNVGKVSPWTSKPCKCTGYKFKKWKRGTQYCECGCQMMGHKFGKRT